MILPLLTGLTIFCLVPATGRVQTQEFKEHIHKEFAALKPSAEVLAIYNLNGPVKIVGYSGDKVVVDIDKSLSAEGSHDLEIAKQEFKLGFDQRNDSIIIYIAEPFDTRPHSWQRNERWNNDDHNYDFNLAFVVRVPFGMNLHISTVNHGDVFVQDVTGDLNVHNVNGPITIKNAKGVTTARTVNGDLTVNYLAVPKGPSDYYTLNGTLAVTYPADLSAVCQFKSMNGDFYTDFANAEALPVEVNRSEDHHASRTVYKLNVAKRVQIGSGGSLFKFETMNGNIYIKKQS